MSTTWAPQIQGAGGGGFLHPSALAPFNGTMSMVDEITHLAGKGMSIRIVPASGGTIISIRNEIDISSSSDLYVIPENQNIAEELGKIITLHYLKS